MKKQKTPVCPGCGRHCPTNALRCKRGRAYFDKLAEKAEPSASQPLRKWEKLVSRGGMLWMLLSAARAVKQALRSGRFTEEQLTARLTTAEQAQLSSLLQKLIPPENTPENS